MQWMILKAYTPRWQNKTGVHAAVGLCVKLDVVTK